MSRPVVWALFPLLLLAGCGAKPASMPDPANETTKMTGTSGPAGNNLVSVGVGPTRAAAEAAPALALALKYEGRATWVDHAGDEIVLHNFSLIRSFGDQTEVYHYWFDASDLGFFARQTRSGTLNTFAHDFGQGPLPFGAVAGGFLLLLVAGQDAKSFQIGGHRFTGVLDGRSPKNDCDWYRLDVEPRLAKAAYGLCVDSDGQARRASVEGWDNLTFVYTGSDSGLKFERASPGARQTEPFDTREWEKTSAFGQSVWVPNHGADPSELSAMATAAMALPATQAWLALRADSYVEQTTFWWRRVFVPSVVPIPSVVDLSLMTFTNGTDVRSHSVVRIKPVESAGPPTYLAISGNDHPVPNLFGQPFSARPQELASLLSVLGRYAGIVPGIEHELTSLPGHAWFVHRGWSHDTSTLWLLSESCERDADGKYLVGHTPRYVYASGSTGQLLAVGMARTLGGCGYGAPDYSEDEGARRPRVATPRCDSFMGADMAAPVFRCVSSS